MFKRTLLAFTFVAALGAASLGTATKAMAWSDCDRYGAAYPYYPSYAVGYGGYAPRVAYYRSVPVRSYPVFYGHGDYGRHPHHDRHDHHRGGVTFSFGF